MWQRWTYKCDLINILEVRLTSQFEEKLKDLPRDPAAPKRAVWPYFLFTLMWFITSVKGIDSVHLHITETKENSPLQHLLIDFLVKTRYRRKRTIQGVFTHRNKNKCSTSSCIFYVTSAPGLSEEVHPLYKTLFVCASPLCFLRDALVCNWQGALIFITCKAVMGVVGGQRRRRGAREGCWCQRGDGNYLA